MEEINRTAFKIASTQGRELLDSRPAVLQGVGQRPDPKGREALLEREAAEAMIGEVREDEPLLAENLRVEAVEVGQST